MQVVLTALAMRPTMRARGNPQRTCTSHRVAYMHPKVMKQTKISVIIIVMLSDISDGSYHER